MKNLKSSLLITAFTLASSALASLSAQTITYVGGQLDLGPDWRDATVTKSYATANNIYGNDGYFIMGAIGSSLPSYVSSVDIGGAQYPGNPAYASIDAPTPTAPYFSGTAITGTSYLNGADPSATLSAYTFTLTGTVPGDIRVGVLWDNTDTNGLSTTSLQLVQATGGSAVSSIIPLTTGNEVPDWYFFDITGASAGSSFSILAINNSTTTTETLQVGGLSFDTATVPEPSTYAMLGLGGLLLLARTFRAHKRTV